MTNEEECARFNEVMKAEGRDLSASMRDCGLGPGTCCMIKRGEVPVLVWHACSTSEIEGTALRTTRHAVRLFNRHV